MKLNKRTATIFISVVVVVVVVEPNAEDFIGSVIRSAQELVYSFSKTVNNYLPCTKN